MAKAKSSLVLRQAYQLWHISYGILVVAGAKSSLVLRQVELEKERDIERKRETEDLNQRWQDVVAEHERALAASHDDLNQSKVAAHRHS